MIIIKFFGLLTVLLFVIPERLYRLVGLSSMHMHTVEYLLVWAGIVFVIYQIYRLLKYLFKKIMK
jgi:hypothetical protein